MDLSTAEFAQEAIIRQMAGNIYVKAHQHLNYYMIKSVYLHGHVHGVCVATFVTISWWAAEGQSTAVCMRLELHLKVDIRVHIKNNSKQIRSKQSGAFHPHKNHCSGNLNDRL
jgi:hypothetical protein